MSQSKINYSSFLLTYLKKSLRIFKKWWFYPIALVVILIILAYKVLELRASDKYFPRLAKSPYSYKFERYQVEDRTMRYLELGQDSLPLIVLIHGAPSSSLSWRSLYADSLLLSKAKIVAVDRPGYGYSGFGKVVTSIAKQAEMLAPVLKKYRTKHKTILLVGSSYGGPIAAKLAMDYPDLMDGLLFNSAAVAPGEEKTYFITYPTTHWLIEWMVPTTLRVANHEKLTHRSELLKIASDWDKITHPCTVLHGVIDDLVYVENAYFMKRKLVNAVDLNMVVLPDKEHGMVFSEPNLVRDVMLDALERTVTYTKKGQ